MSQRTIIFWLKAHPRQKFSARELSEYLNVSIQSIHRNLIVLRETKIVKYKVVTGQMGRYGHETRYWFE